MSETTIKTRLIVNGKWIAIEKKLNDNSPDNAFEFSTIVLKSIDGLKRVILTLDNDGVLKLTDDQNATYRVLLSGITSQCGEVEFVNVKIMNVTFIRAFTRKPSVVLTLGDISTNPPFRVTVTKTGFTIKFQNNFSGNVQWQATEA